MQKCPYCYNELQEKPKSCPFCNQFVIDDLVHTDYPSLEKKECLFCGKKILKESKICQFCHKWFDEVNEALKDLDLDDLYED